MELTKTQLVSIYNKRMYDRFHHLKIKKNPIDYYQIASIFEMYCCIRLMNGKDTNLPMYLYEDIPIDFKIEKQWSKYDTGIDFSDLNDVLGQCKLRSNCSITRRDVSTFLAFILEHQEINDTICRPILTYNKDCSLPPNIQNLHKKGRMELKPYDIYEMIQYCESISKPKIEKYVFKGLRHYQEECINIGKETNKHMLIHLPTGTGKTLIMSQYIDLNIYQLILVPRIILMEQTQECILQYRPDCKGKIQMVGGGNSTSNRDVKIHKPIVISVYNSLPKILKSVENGVFQKIHIDEFHHIVKPLFENDELMDDEDELKEDSKYIEIMRSWCEEWKFQDEHPLLYGYSATIDVPFDMNSNEEEEEEEEEGILLKKHWDYYHKGIREMIQNGYLVDYQFRVPIFKYRTLKRVCDYIIQNTFHTIIYCKNREEGLEINTLLNERMKESSAYIDCQTPKRERRSMIQKYRKGEFKYLVNVRVLIEGFDAPITQDIVVLHPSKSKQMMIQIIGRGLRLYSEKNKLTIHFPLIEEEEGKVVSKVIQRIVNEDEKYYDLIQRRKQFCGIIEMSREDEEDEDEEEEISDKGWDEIMYEIVYDSMGRIKNNEEIWWYKYRMLKEYIEINNKRPSYKTQLGNWLSHQLENYKKKKYIMKNETIYNEWTNFMNEYSELFKSNEDVWYDYLNELKEYIEINNKRPSNKTQLGKWLSHQLNNYKKKKYIMKNESIRKDFESLLLMYPNIFSIIQI